MKTAKARGTERVGLETYPITVLFGPCHHIRGQAFLGQHLFEDGIEVRTLPCQAASIQSGEFLLLRLLNRLTPARKGGFCHKRIEVLQGGCLKGDDNF